MIECIVFLNQYKVALSGYALRYFISLVHKMYEDMPCMDRILHIGDQQPMEKGIRQQIHDQEDVERILQSSAKD